MQHGKRGFDRLVYGCKSISDTPVNWICTLEDKCEYYYIVLVLSRILTRLVDSTTSLDQISNAKVSSDPATQQIKTHQIVTPSMPSLDADTAADLYEWLSLVRLGSPRVLYKDSIDPYLSRYSPPDCPPGEINVGRISWDGLMSPSWVSNLASALLAACPEDSWFAICATDMPAGGLGGHCETTIMKPPGQNSRYWMWDIKHS